MCGIEERERERGGRELDRSCRPQPAPWPVCILDVGCGADGGGGEVG